MKKKFKENIGFILLGIVLFLGIVAISFGITYGFVWVICWAFGLNFSLKIVIGVWAIQTFIGLIFTGKKQ